MKVLEDGQSRIPVDVNGVCHFCEFFVPKNEVASVTIKCKKQAIFWSVQQDSQYWIRTNNKICPHIKKFMIRDKLDRI